MERPMNLKSQSDYRIEKMTWSELKPYFQQHRPTLFQSTFDFSSRSVMTDTELEALERLGKNMGTPFTLNLGMFQDDELVG